MQRRKGGVYYFRRAVPEDLREIIGKREIVVSLKTTDPDRAKRLVKVEDLKTDNNDTRAMRVFPALKADRHGSLTGIWSKWWGRHARKMAVDACRAVMTEEHRHALTGHSGGGVGRTLRDDGAAQGAGEGDCEGSVFGADGSILAYRYSRRGMAAV